jgi:hypothetical protein
MSSLSEAKPRCFSSQIPVKIFPNHTPPARGPATMTGKATNKTQRTKTGTQLILQALVCTSCSIRCKYDHGGLPQCQPWISLSGNENFRCASGADPGGPEPAELSGKINYETYPTNRARGRGAYRYCACLVRLHDRRLRGDFRTEHQRRAEYRKRYLARP